MNDVTRILSEINSGNAAATNDLLPIVYDELRRLAASRLSHETPGQTLQPTALVHEAWMRLVGSEGEGWENRSHFFGAAAEAMRRILVDNARRKQRLKRGGPNAERFEIDEADRIALPIADEVLDLHEALDGFEQIEPAKAQIVKLKFFAGMTTEEIASVMGLSVATVERHWTYSRAWLHQKVQE